MTINVKAKFPKDTKVRVKDEALARIYPSPRHDYYRERMRQKVFIVCGYSRISKESVRVYEPGHSRCQNFHYSYLEKIVENPELREP